MFSAAGVKYLWRNGEVIPWEKGTIHIWDGGFTLPPGIFEGIRGYQKFDGNDVYVFRLRPHMKRLFASAKIHRLQISHTVEELEKAVTDVIAGNNFRDDVYIRPMVWPESGPGLGWSETKGEAAVMVVPSPKPARLKKMENGINVRVSTWRRLPDSVMPPRAKTNGNYVQSRYATMEALADGYDDAIFMTFNGKVSEGTGATLAVIRDGVLVMPSITSDILEGITRDTMLKVVGKDLGMCVVERDVDRTELYIADELFFCGTGAELTPIVSVDRVKIGDGKPGPLTKKIQACYFDIVRGKNEKYKEWLTPTYQKWT